MKHILILMMSIIVLTSFSSCSYKIEMRALTEKGHVIKVKVDRRVFKKGDKVIYNNVTGVVTNRSFMLRDEVTLTLD